MKLEDGSLSFGRVLNEPLMAFYDCKSENVLDVNDVISRPILFRIWVMNNAIESGRWQVLGNIPLDLELEETPRFFKQNSLSKKLSIYFEGEETPATKEECQGLERAAVWDPEHVEDRLRDYFAGVPNQWVESLKVK
ncbi:immunity 26/phosphotriesterase HocA family protein [Reinekea marina]|uniref:immunity 26/phosphotriesterase HocA family protein n=1 Tax=Reinekea marina TaxID=1310421 RepID=UPI0025B48F6E|nr:immunity 26/phosphotriesterase HocA family protein [Reinekea marina]MDN3649150.1 immunity 26/phosphotriesterase HocA family protein [Reinekea marina]